MNANHNKKIIIIGGGIGGLSAGCYLQKNGYSTRIIEMGRECGGVCVSWKRGGYVFDGATNWLVGSSPSINLHGLLSEVVPLNKLDFRYSEIFISIEYGGKILDVYKNAGRFKEELLRISPQDSKLISELTDAISAVRELNIPYGKPRELFSIMDYARFPFENRRLLMFLSKWSRISIAQYASRFKSPHLREMLKLIFPHHEFFSMFGIIMSLGWMNARSDGYPLGGSSHFTRVMEQSYRELGGAISLNTRVNGCIIENGCVKGVTCLDGTKFDAHTVISSADNHETVFDILKGEYCDPAAKKRFDHWPVFPSMIQVSIGLGRKIENHADKYELQLALPVSAGTCTVSDIIARFCTGDPSFAPQGKTSAVVHIRTNDWKYWHDMREQSPQKYREEKNRIAEAVIDTLERRFGNIAECVEVCDVATPATYIRYTGVWKGSYQGWAPVPGVVARNISKTIPGLRNFYMAGQWMWPGGGLTGVIRLSRDVAYMICERDGKKFTAGK
jgi:phytoene dehydrogenase-like protein